MNTLDEKEVTQEEIENLQEQVVNQSVNQLLNISEHLSLEELMKLIGKEYTKVKYKKVLDTSEIERIYKDAIGDYMERVENLKVKKDAESKNDME